LAAAVEPRRSLNRARGAVDDQGQMLPLPRAGVASLALLMAAACGRRDPGRPDGAAPDAAVTADAEMPDHPGDDAGEPSDGAAAADVALAAYFPFAVGNLWEYRVTPAGGLAHLKIHRVVRLERVGGEGPSKDVVAARVETLKKNSAASPTVNDASISWQLRQGAQVVRFRETSCSMGSAILNADGSAIESCTVDVEDSWTPPRPRIDEQPMGRTLAQDMSWQSAYTESKITYSYADPSMPSAIRTSKQGDDQWRVVDIGVGATVPAGTFADCVVLEKRSITDVVKTYTFCRGVGKVKEVGGGQTEELASMPTLR
jgi:hypothetical protein